MSELDKVKIELEKAKYLISLLEKELKYKNELLKGAS